MTATTPATPPARDSDAPQPAPAVTDATPPDPRIRLRSAYAVWLRNRDVFLRLWRWLLVPNIAEHAMTMAAIGFGIGSYVTGFGSSYAEFVAPGLVCASAMWSAGFECSYGTFHRMQKQRTFDAIIATPVQIDDVVLGELGYGAFRGFVSGALITVMFAVLGLLDSWLAIFLLPMSALVGFLLAALAVTAAARAPVMETLSYFVSFILMPMFWLGGIFYRPDSFGEWASYVQWAVPIYHAVEASRQLAAGDVRLSMLAHMAVLLTISIVFTFVAIDQMRRRLIR